MRMVDASSMAFYFLGFDEAGGSGPKEAVVELTSDPIEA